MLPGRVCVFLFRWKESKRARAISQLSLQPKPRKSILNKESCRDIQGATTSISVPALPCRYRIFTAREKSFLIQRHTDPYNIDRNRYPSPSIEGGRASSLLTQPRVTSQRTRSRNQPWRSRRSVPDGGAQSPPRSRGQGRCRPGGGNDRDHFGRSDRRCVVDRPG